jgi:hypothetical protein
VRLEVESASGTSRAPASAACVGENRERQHHLEIEDAYADTVARSGGLRWTGEVAISRQSFRRRMGLLVRDRFGS